jgi:hypothetical protein
MYQVVHLNACTDWYIILPEEKHEKKRRCGLVCTRFCHLACWDDLLCLSWSDNIRDHENPLLGGLRCVLHPFGSPLRRDSSMAAHRADKLGIGGASASPSWDGWRSYRAFQPIHLHPQPACHFGRQIRSLSVCFVRTRSRNWRGGNAKSNAAEFWGTSSLKNPPRVRGWVAG